MKKTRINIFLSWSGSSSREIARVMAEWLANLSPKIQTFVEGDEIQAGSRWLDQVMRTLRSCDVAILILTKQNSPWMNFEAGYLTAQAHERDLLLIPILFGLNPSQLSGPLNMYQSAEFNERSFIKISKEILNKLDLENGERKLAENNALSHYQQLKEKVFHILKKEEQLEENNKSDSKRASSSFLESWRRHIDD
jgi:hypothetical protein